MKSLILAAFIGSAAAFAPAQTGKASTQLRALEIGLAPPPLGFFDSLSGKDIFGAGNENVNDGYVNLRRNDLDEIELQERAAIQEETSFSPFSVLAMKVVSSIGSMKKRSKTCQIVKRRGRIYLIDKSNPRNKVRQGGAKMAKKRRSK